MEIHDRHAAEIALDPTSHAPTGIVVHYIRLAYFFAGTHREEEAAEFVRKAARATERLTGPFELLNAHYLIAIAQLRLGDRAGYRETCKALGDVPVTGVDDITKVTAILTLCLAPDGIEEYSLSVNRAEELAANNSVEQPHIIPYVVGAASIETGSMIVRWTSSKNPSLCTPKVRGLTLKRTIFSDCCWRCPNGNREKRMKRGDCLPKPSRRSTRTFSLLPSFTH